MLEPSSLADEVAAALAAGRAVVALESTIFSNLGLPSPANAEALARCIAAVAGGGAVPAVTAVLDGVARVGLDAGEHERILGPARKAAERDLAVAVAQGWPFGATTVSASVALAAAGRDLGVRHRRHRRRAPGRRATGDVSADLDAIARHPVVTVCAGAKAFLDLARTLEDLETVGVPGARLAPRLVPGVLHPLVGPAGAAPGRDGGEVAAVLGHRVRRDDRRARRRAHPRGRRARRGGPRRRASTGRWPTPPPPASPEPRSRRSCWPASPRRPKAAASRPTWPWPSTTPGWPPRSPSRWGADGMSDERVSDRSSNHRLPQPQLT